MPLHHDNQPHSDFVNLPAGGDDRDARYERFVILFARTEAALHSYLLSLLPHWDDAEEVLQQVSLILWRKFDDYRPGSSFRAWACQVARYEALNYRKKTRRDRHVFGEELTGLIAAESLEDLDRLDSERRALSGCLELLKSEDRRLLERCYSQEVPVVQLAVEYDRSANSLYKKLNRLRARLLKCIRRRLKLEGSA